MTYCERRVYTIVAIIVVYDKWIPVYDIQEIYNNPLYYNMLYLSILKLNNTFQYYFYILILL